MNDGSQISYMNHLDKIINRNISFILCVIKSRNSDIYNGINRKLCLEASGKYIQFKMCTSKLIILVVYCFIMSLLGRH